MNLAVAVDSWMKKSKKYIYVIHTNLVLTQPDLMYY